MEKPDFKQIVIEWLRSDEFYKLKESPTKFTLNDLIACGVFGAEHAYNLSLSRQRELEKENQELRERLAEMDMF